jgi:2,3-bisphosphoglycerate-independent phosphoglycerate mutase
VEVFVKPVKEHRAVVVFRGEGLSDKVCDTDPQVTGVKPLEPKATEDDAGSERTAQVAKSFVSQVKEILAAEKSANMLLLRGFSMKPKLPQMSEVYKLKCGAVAQYPMYRGIAKLLGMDVLDAGETFEDEFQAVAEARAEYDYFFVHIKPTDSAGEDGDFDRKVAKIEEVDKALPVLLEGGMDVVAVTGDHSTPAVYGAHSWHPVPALLHSQYCRQDKVTEFAERTCRCGSLGMIESKYLMYLMLANARRLEKYGA